MFVLPCLTTSLECFECHIVEHSDFFPNETQQLCEKFNQTDKFMKKCENSTFCRKTVISADIAGVLIGTERDCVSNIYVSRVRYETDGAWHSTHETPEESISEGCYIVNNYGLKSVTVQHCYCKTNYCNSGKAISLSFFMFLLWTFIEYINLY